MKKGLLLLVLLTGCITGQVALPQESGAVFAFFCDRDDCEERFRVITENASSLVCAMYHPTKGIATAALTKGGLVVDGSHAVAGAVVESGAGLMHNKFCVINKSVVWTGSWNPAQQMTIPNNVILIESRTLARAFEDEFVELEKGVFQEGERGSARVLLNGNLTESFFCPEDECARNVLKVIDSAKSSVHVMAYSFTDDAIGKLLERKAGEGVDVKVIFDPRKDDKSSEYPRLKEHARVAKVHHKVFIIDGKAVITGSMNPTRSGNENNDENIVIVREASVVKAFEEEFARIWVEST